VTLLRENKKNPSPSSSGVLVAPDLSSPFLEEPIFFSEYSRTFLFQKRDVFRRVTTLNSRKRAFSSPIPSVAQMRKTYFFLEKEPLQERYTERDETGRPSPPGPLPDGSSSIYFMPPRCIFGHPRAGAPHSQGQIRALPERPPRPKSAISAFSLAHSHENGAIPPFSTFSVFFTSCGAATVSCPSGHQKRRFRSSPSSASRLACCSRTTFRALRRLARRGGVASVSQSRRPIRDAKATRRHAPQCHISIRFRVATRSRVHASRFSSRAPMGARESENRIVTATVQRHRKSLWRSDSIYHSVFRFD